jgi:hypothetical protein
LAVGFRPKTGISVGVGPKLAVGRLPKVVSGGVDACPRSTEGHALYVEGLHDVSSLWPRSTEGKPLRRDPSVLADWTGIVAYLPFFFSSPFLPP